MNNYTVVFRGTKDDTTVKAGSVAVGDNWVTFHTPDVSRAIVAAFRSEQVEEVRKEA